jgi:hypothetical protein
MFIITREENEYNQYGQYFVTAFENIPSISQVLTITGNDKGLALHILSGGGRRNLENTWYKLHKINDGETLKI